MNSTASISALRGRTLPARVRAGDAGFSLVECALALAIVAFGYVAVLGLAPVGLATFRTAVDASVGAEIFQHVVTDLEQMEFDALLDEGAGVTTGDFFALPTRYFDDQGSEVKESESARIIYRVHARVSRPGPATGESSEPHFTSLPAAAGEQRFHPRDSVFVAVQIAHNPGNLPLELDGNLLWAIPPIRQGALALATYSTVIARNGYAHHVDQLAMP